MSKTDVREVLKRPYRLFSSKASYRTRKILRHKSVREFSSYEDYVDEQVNRMEKSVRAAVVASADSTKATTPKIEKISPKTTTPLPIKKIAPTQMKDSVLQPSNRFLEMLTAGHVEAFMEVIEKFASTGAPLLGSEVANYAKSCVELGEPGRLIESRLIESKDYCFIPRFRAQYFVALLSRGDFIKARSFMRESIALGYYDLAMLLRMMGETSIIGCPEICPTIARIVMREYREKVTPHQLIYICNVLVSQGNYEIAAELVGPGAFKSIEADACFFQSNLAHQEGDYGSQAVNITGALSRFGLRGIALRDISQPLSILNISSAVHHSELERGPRVTVAMSTFNSAGTVVSALESLTAQDYRDLEILVVDDCSSDETVDLVLAYASRVDSRVSVIRQEVNGGTYRARNRALRDGTGEFFICNDSDDWSHPQRISSLVRALLENSDRSAAHSQLIRLSSVKGVKPKLNGYSHDDQSSLMYRRSDVIDKIGFYYPVTVGADSEFSARLERAFGKNSIHKIKKPLLFADWSPSSLSAAPTTGITDGGTMAPMRMQFRRLYRAKHASGLDLRVEYNSGFEGM